MSNRIDIANNKTLKLTNVLIRKIEFGKEENIQVVVEQMINFLKARGAMPIGPLIQKTSYSIREDGELDIEICLMQQANTFIHKTEVPFEMEPVIRVQNCMYAHYVGPEDMLKFAYDKINIAAFEEEIRLEQSNYTIFVNQQDDIMTADVFVEKKSDE